MLPFPDRLKRFRDLHELSDAELGRMLGVHGQTVGQIIRRKKGFSKPLEVLLDHLDRERAVGPKKTSEELREACITQIVAIYKLDRRQTLEALLPLLELLAIPRPENRGAP